MTQKQWANFIALTVIWGASFVWIKVAVRESGPFTIVTMRLVFAMLALLAFIIKEKPKLPARNVWWQYAVQGMMSMAVPWLLIVWAEQYIDAALATVLNSTVPMFTIVAAHFILHDDRITRARVAGLLLGFVGVVALVQRDLGPVGAGIVAGGGTILLAQLAMLLAAACYGFSNIFARAKFRKVPPIVQAFIPMIYAEVVMMAVTPVVEAPFTLPSHWLTWTAIAWLGILGAGISYLMFYHLLHEIGPTRVAVVTYTIPVVGVTLSVLLLNERLDLSLVLGTLLIVSGVWVVNRR